VFDLVHGKPSALPHGPILQPGLAGVPGAPLPIQPAVPPAYLNAGKAADLSFRGDNLCLAGITSIWRE